MPQVHSAGAASIRLNDGRVLVVGGYRGLLIDDTPGTQTSAYDRATDQWTTLSPMKTARAYHDMVKLADGRVLVSGGYVGWSTGKTATAELFDPQTNTWSNAGTMTVARTFHTSVLLPDGRVLVAGGAPVNGTSPPIRPEVYDPVANTWTPIVSPLDPWHGLVALARLPSGAILFLTGSDAFILDAAANTVRSIALPSTPRRGAKAIALADGRILLAGGSINVNGTNTAVALVDVFDPTTETWAPTASMSSAFADGDRLLRGSDGRPVVLGYPNRVESYDAATATWTVLAPLAATATAATALPDGKLLVVEKWSAELYEIAPATCTLASCASLGKTCGTIPDGCGGTLSCGTCAAGSICSASNVCTTGSTSTCAHSECTTGDKLITSCSSCATTVCASDSYCCKNSWDATCVNEAKSMCGSLCGTSTCTPTTCQAQGKSCGTIPNGCGGTLSCGTCAAGSTCSASNVCTADSTNVCAHSECTTGSKLSSSCSSCAANVCASDGYCCNSSWDATCVNEAKSMCGSLCGTSTCTPTTCQAQGKNCGTISNGCGGTLSCGTCAAGSTCSASNTCTTGSTSTCDHSVCTTGTKLASSCSSCVATVCASDSYCCNSSWDSTCVNEAKSWCAAGTCP